MEPTVICPKCKAEIKLTESLAAPLVESIRLDYEKRLTQKDADMARRETTMREREAAMAMARESLDDQVAEKLKLERARIVTEESVGKEKIVI
jgi:thiamine biosynthesis protein ThiC